MQVCMFKMQYVVYRLFKNGMFLELYALYCHKVLASVLKCLHDAVKNIKLEYIALKPLLTTMEYMHCFIAIAILSNDLYAKSVC